MARARKSEDPGDSFLTPGHPPGTALSSAPLYVKVRGAASGPLLESHGGDLGLATPLMTVASW